jgi:plastocyanin
MWGMWTAAVATSSMAAGHRVTIDAMAFTPRVVQARPGDTITWVNKDMFVHNVTADAGLHSGELQPGRSWTFTVPAGAAIDYACTLHPTMRGHIDIIAQRPKTR